MILGTTTSASGNASDTRSSATVAPALTATKQASIFSRTPPIVETTTLGTPRETPKPLGLAENWKEIMPSLERRLESEVGARIPAYARGAISRTVDPIRATRPDESARSAVVTSSSSNPFWDRLRIAHVESSTPSYVRRRHACPLP